MEKVERKNIKIPKDLHKKAKFEALKEDKTLEDYISDVLKKNLKEGEEINEQQG